MTELQINKQMDINKKRYSIIVYDENGKKLIDEKMNMHNVYDCNNYLYGMGKTLSEITKCNYYLYDSINKDMFQICHVKDKNGSFCAFINDDKIVAELLIDGETMHTAYLHDSLKPISNDDIELKIRYHHEIYGDFDHITKLDNGDFIDLRCAQDTTIKPGEFKLIPLGISVQIPKGYYMELVPRSSTFKNFHILQANSIGIIDESYCGDDDMLFFPAFCPITADNIGATIKVNDRFCQFRLVKKSKNINIIEVDKLNNDNRGGFGSTGRN